jgi:uncharacterized protein RhaS with RHS repeats
MYDPSLGRWHVGDPLAERRNEWSNYAYVLNNPMLRIDPDGLTDYKFDKETGEVNEVTYEDEDEQSANDAAETDRIVKTDKNGNIKRKKFGKNKGQVKTTDITDSEKGILSDGMNLKTESHIIEVNGEGQATTTGVEAFALKLSEHVGKEIGGAYFSSGSGNTTHMTLGLYQYNSSTRTSSSGHTLGFRNNLNLTGFFHSHPKIGTDNSNRVIPHDADLRMRNNALQTNPNLLFYIITNPITYGGEYPNKIPYTNY